MCGQISGITLRVLKLLLCDDLSLLLGYKKNVTEKTERKRGENWSAFLKTKINRGRSGVWFSGRKKLKRRRHGRGGREGVGWGSHTKGKSVCWPGPSLSLFSSNRWASAKKEGDPHRLTQRGRESARAAGAESFIRDEREEAAGRRMKTLPRVWNTNR